MSWKPNARQLTSNAVTTVSRNNCIRIAAISSRGGGDIVTTVCITIKSQFRNLYL